MHGRKKKVLRTFIKSTSRSSPPSAKFKIQRND